MPRARHVAAIGAVLLSACAAPVTPSAPTIAGDEGGPSAAASSTVGPATPPQEQPGASSGSSSIPPPPSTFDATSVRWLSAYEEDETAIWAASIDGSGLDRILEGLVTRVVELPGGGLVYTRPSDRPAATGELFVAAPGGRDERSLGHITGRWVVAPGDGAVYLSHHDEDANDDGLWRHPLDGTRPTRVLPPLPERINSVRIAVTTDGLGVARGADGPDQPPWMDGKVDGDYLRLPDGVPIGFEVSGDLVFREKSGEGGIYERYRFDDEVAEQLGIFEVSQALVTGDGRYLVVFDHNEEGRGESVVAIDLASRTEQRWTVNGVWTMTAFGAPGIVVLERSFGDGLGEHLIVNAAEGWIGLLPPIELPAKH